MMHINYLIIKDQYKKIRKTSGRLFKVKDAKIKFFNTVYSINNSNAMIERTNFKSVR